MMLKMLKFGFAHIFVLVIFLMVGCSSQNSASVGVKLIADNELSTLYGGSWGSSAYNPYCDTYGASCPAVVGCGSSDPQQPYLNKCRICVPNPGMACFRAFSWIPDWDGCTDSTPNCPEGVPGYCTGPDECEPDGGHDPPYPSCTASTYNYCDD